MGTIEWYHRLRNELYHQGNGLTVERDKVEIYAELANVLFKNLFGYTLVEAPDRKTELLGEFLTAWAEVERGLRALVEREMVKTMQPRGRPTTLIEGLRLAHRKNLISSSDLREIEELRTIRNTAAHAQPGWEGNLTQGAVDKVRNWAKKILDIGKA